MNIQFPYGKEFVTLDVDEKRVQGVLTSTLHGYKADKSQTQLVKDAIENPIGSPKLSFLARGKDTIIIIASDHTRPVPSKIIMPLMLDEIRKGNPKAQITILIATGCHRDMTKQELIDKFGLDIVAHEHIEVHNSIKSPCVKIGTLPSGGECLINKMVIDADLVCSEGFIEPHFFAGFSGSRKSILPGVANKKTVLANHCSEFIADPHARTGVLEGNPIHQDMVWAARKAHLDFIVNVVINGHKDVIYAVAGDMEKAHEEGCRFLSSICQTKAIPSDIVISTNGGYPLDQNVYQAVKGMTAAEATVKERGVIIMIAKSNDGIGGDHFYQQLAGEKDINKTMALFLSRGRGETRADQWQTQIFLRILQKATVIYVSKMDQKTIEDMHMVYAASLPEALHKAEEILHNDQATITAIPDGVSVMVVD